VHFGGFQLIRNERECRGINSSNGNGNKRELQGFNNFIDNMELVDIPCIGENILGIDLMIKQRTDLIDS